MILALPLVQLVNLSIAGAELTMCTTVNTERATALKAGSHEDEICNETMNVKQ